MNNSMLMFYGIIVIGWKGMDFFFFMMNFSFWYEIMFLNQIFLEFICVVGKGLYEVVNYIQCVFGGVLGFECINYMCRDKYWILVGMDGIVGVKF